MITTKSSRPRRLETVRRRVDRWRGTRAHVRSPMPAALWAAAVALVRQHGVYRTARGLRINYGTLKQHVEAADDAAGAGVPSGFVELAGPPPTARDACVIEIEGPRATVRLRLNGLSLPDLARLSRALSGADA
jgi:hypothetical protein